MAGDSEIGIRIGADITGLVAGLNNAGGAVKKFGSSSETAAAGVGILQKLAGAAAVTMAVAFVKASYDAINAQSDLAAQLGTTSASIATMTRAADLAGISQSTFESASKKLSLQLAAAADGSGKSAELFSRLGLSVSQLSAMPLDERFAAINRAISENIPKTEQAAAAQQLFGKGAALAISALSPELIAQSAHEMEVLGLNISEIDAAAVGASEDSIKLLGLAAQGVGQQLSTQLAPYIQAIGDSFFDSAEAGGNFGNAIQATVEVVIGVVGAMADAFAGFKRVVVVVFSAVMETLGVLALGVGKAVEGWTRLFNAIPGVNMDESEKSITDFNNTTLETLRGLNTQLKNQFNEPLPSERFGVYTEQAKKAASEAAKLNAAANIDTGGGTADTTEQDKAAAKNAEQLAQKLAALADSYKTESQLLEQSYAEQNALIAAGVNSGQLTRDQGRAMETAAQQKFAADSIALSEKQTAADKKAMEEKTKAAEALNAKLETVRDSFKTEAQLLNDSYAEKAAIIAEWENAETGRQVEANELRAAARQQYNDKIVAMDQEAANAQIALEEAKNAALMASSANALSAIGNLLATGGKKDFENSKRLGLAAAAISMYTGIAAGLKLGWPAAIPAVAYATATGLSAIRNIKSQTATGGATGAVSSGGAPTLPTDPNVAGNAGASGGGGGQNITVRGINPGQFFSGQQILDIINAATANGGVLKAG